MPSTTLRAGLVAAALLAPLAALAGDITIADPYARVSTAQSVSGAAFMDLINRGATDDRLVSASSPVAERVELHTHKEDANGVMQMVEVEGGIAIPAGADHALARGGDHVMLIGLTRPLAQGDRFPLTLVFEKAGSITIEVPVDLKRAPGMDHGKMDHGAMHGGQPAAPSGSY